MKKGLIVIGAILLLTGCGSKKTNNDDPSQISYTNKFECSKSEKIKQYDLESRNEKGMFIGTDKAKRSESPVAINEITTKIYDFNKSGDKLIAYYEIITYEYLIDGYNMEDEKKFYENKCDNYSEYGFKTCQISTKDKKIVITKTANLESDYNKNTVSSMTKESIKNDYAGGEVYTCTE